MCAIALNGLTYIRARTLMRLTDLVKIVAVWQH